MRHLLLDNNLLLFLSDVFLSRTGRKAAIWLRAQDIPDDDRLYNLLLASAAIPLAFPKREVNGKFYVDGALGDNIPVGALRDRGCEKVIVIHLDNGETWSRHEFPEQTVIEIRPERRINKSNKPLSWIDSMLDFRGDRIDELKRRGYEDARRCLERIIQTFKVVSSQRQARKELIDSTQRLLNDAPLL